MVMPQVTSAQVVDRRPTPTRLSATWRSVKRHRWAYFLLAPNLLLFLVFMFLPIIASLFISLHDWDLVSPMRFVGLGNFRVLLRDDLFWLALRNTLYFTVGVVPVETVLSLGLALIMNGRIRFRDFFRTATYIPVVSSLVIVGLLFKWLYDSDYGLINYLLLQLGLPRLLWLTDPDLAMPSIMIMRVWKSLGFYMILFLAGLQNISRTYYEAAEIDGAGPWAQFRHITFPLLNPTIVFVLVISTIWSLQVFESIYVMTLGGPMHATETIVFQVYLYGFRYLRMGYASALAWVLFLLVIGLSVLQHRYASRDTE
jgi:multiple sugar transport system permease protein